MKLYKYIYFFFICLSMSACKDDDNGSDNTERPDPLAWIEDTMRKHYYWYSEIPASGRLNYESDEKTFFGSLLSSKDGKSASGGSPYSYIENTADKNTRSSIQEHYSYGIEFRGIYINLDNNVNTREIGVLVLYVVPGSPADRAGLTRGDWILKMGNSYIRDETYASLSGGERTTLSVSRWDTGTEKLVLKDSNVVLEEAEPVVDHPVNDYRTITRGSSTVGYLLYTHFTPGTDNKYDNALREISTEFFNKGVKDVVLDLRYNNGGFLSSALVLCAILANKTALDQKFVSLRYNDKQRLKSSDYSLLTSYLNPGGKNLNLNRLYVLTSSSTASASEMVIASLSPFMDVIVIGDQTVGKNVGSVEYPTESEPYPYGTTTWVMHPIVSQISNSLGFTDYADGFVPGKYNKTNQGSPESERGYIDEAFDYEVDPKDGKTYGLLTETLPLGDPNERMLNVALRMIDGTYTRTVATPSSTGRAYELIPGSSIDRKATNSVIIDIEQPIK